MGAHFGWKQKIFHPIKLLFIPQGGVLLSWGGVFAGVRNFF
ncbi:hypothetical protein POREN0001_0690 [Porphyromonas endodontalis ATCC 35406]|uniref:Uncharacterized protein n=1 Tax=Porphyromonas endodontalis (strain ATCC 35406 / DSM 24491 / JCM 8526 / CCUG 16442 / BCRC 14492 / NCTC 13058 / HG 370) TaxID=553175 RepID=C3JD03_POREA|nr:hypothetical protein POREN0001_0690 [Porphyromonas endodontalis ATCC 35406]